MKTPDLTIDLGGCVSVVTGGAKGLGRGAAWALAQAGSDIVVADIDKAAAEELGVRIRESGRRYWFVETNMMNADEIERLTETVKHSIGTVNILVNNVGGGRPQSFDKQSQNSIRRHIDLNLMSTLLTTQQFLPLMIKGGRGGAIINVASTEALRAAPGFAVYAACKAAIVNFTKSMALEQAAHGIRSFALAPDMIETPGLAPLMNVPDPASVEARNRYIPNGRVGNIAEFGQVVAFLASDLASYMNGVTIPVDAGATAAAGWYRNPNNEWCLYHSIDR